MAKKDTMTTKNDQELSKLLMETREALKSERFAAAGARAKDPSAARKLRKIIARVLTEQSVRSTQDLRSIRSAQDLRPARQTADAASVPSTESK